MTWNVLRGLLRATSFRFGLTGVNGGDGTLVTCVDYEWETHLFGIVRELKDVLNLLRHFQPCGPPAHSTTAFAVPFKHVLSTERLQTTWAEVGWIMCGVVTGEQAAETFAIAVVSFARFPVDGEHDVIWFVLMRHTTVPQNDHLPFLPSKDVDGEVVLPLDRWDFTPKCWKADICEVKACHFAGTCWAYRCALRHSSGTLQHAAPIANTVCQYS